MKTVLLNIDYTDSTKKFWFESYVKNQKVTYDPEKQTIHEVIKDVCNEEGMILTYKGKPQSNVFRDKKDGSSHIVGYMYRGKTEIYDRNMSKPQTAFFDVWVSISTVNEFEFEEVNPW